MKTNILRSFLAIATLLVASCTKEIYHQVTFIIDSFSKEIEVLDNAKVDLNQVPDPKKEGYSFLGWYENERKVFLEDLIITRDYILEARYQIKQNEQNRETILYSHTLIRGDIGANEETVTLSGLSWSHTAIAFLGAYTYGIQIGSRNNPQTTPLVFSTSFPETTRVLGYSLFLCTASGGSADFIVSMDDYEHTEPFSNVNDPLPYGVDELEVTTESFSITLQAKARAIYFQKIEILLDLPENHGLNISSGNDIPDGPVVINIPKEFDLSSYSDSEYYRNVSIENDTVLLTTLRTTISSNMKARSYADAKSILLYTDEDVENPGYDYGLYDGDLIIARWDSGASWNREHVWACAQMQLTDVTRPNESTKNHTSDLHNLRVACGPSNGHHGNLFFDDYDVANLTINPNVTSLSGAHANSGDHRGDVARILFYMYVRYDGLRLNDELDVNDDLSMGKLSSLLRWCFEDPVDAFEKQRNDRIYEYQGNRNPFIDHPEYASILF
ncbi:MAG: endonuclease [Erysipelotrichaceae bacterium]|jgi:endonuclease I|nr:endonuclease [Erysipelotrichaceae bacterium]